MSKLLNYLKSYNGENVYLNSLFVSICAFLCSFWAPFLGEPVLIPILLGVALNTLLLWKQKSFFNKFISALVYNVVFAFFTDFTLYETTKIFLGMNNPWRLSLIVFLAGLIRVPAYYVMIVMIHYFQQHKDKFLNNPYFYIGIYASILALTERYAYLIVPTEVGFAFLSNIEYLGLLPVFSLLIYSFFGYFISFVFTLRLIHSDFNLKPFYFMTAFIVCGSLGLSFIKTEQINYDSSQNLKVKVVQYPFHELKNNKENIDPEMLMEKTLLPILENNKADLTLFSESSLPYIYDNFHNLRQMTNLDKIIASDSDVLLSAIKQENKLMYNTSLLFRKQELPQTYYKNYLFPVGEREMLPVTLLNYGDKVINSSLASKNQQVLMKTKKDFYFSPMLCFENYHAYYLGKYPTNKVSSFFTLQSNESWIGDLKLRDLSKLFVQIRSAENAMYGIKIDSMGPSFIVTPQGKISYITYYPKLSFDYNLPKKVNTDFNFFLRYGSLPFFMFMLIYLAFFKLRQQRFK